jgi:hypothetical protein
MIVTRKGKGFFANCKNGNISVLLLCSPEYIERGVLYPSLRVGEIGRKGKKKAEEASSGKVEYSQNLPHKESTAS